MPTPERLARIVEVAKHRLHDVVFVLEDLHDPHNAGAVLRTAQGFGIAKAHFLFLQEHLCQPCRATKGTAMGAQQWLSICVWRSREELLGHLSREGFASWGFVAQEGAENMWQHDWRESRVALWFGNEHRGLTPETCQALDALATNPMWGMVRSFNISVAAAIALAEVVRQTRYRAAPIASHP